MILCNDAVASALPRRKRVVPRFSTAYPKAFH